MNNNQRVTEMSKPIEIITMAEAENNIILRVNQPETNSPFQTVASIKIEQQNFNHPESLTNCERSSFNPLAQSLAKHEPLGRMNKVRRWVYANAAKLRNKE